MIGRFVKQEHIIAGIDQRAGIEGYQRAVIYVRDVWQPMFFAAVGQNRIIIKRKDERIRIFGNGVVKCQRIVRIVPFVISFMKK